MSYNYTIEEEICIINFVKAGDIKNASKLLLSVLDKNTIDDALTIPIIRCLIFDIVSTMLKLLCDFMKDKNSKIIELSPEINKLLILDDFDEIKSTMIYILTQVCEFVQFHSNVLLKDKVFEYINKNYRDHNLSGSKIAESLGYNASYLSVTFKKQTGQNLVDYINQKRVDISKTYLINKLLPIEKVAYEVGYSNPSSYVRAFIKQYGVTPSKFRKIY